VTRIRPAERATDRTAALCATTVRLGIDERPNERIGEARVPVVVPEEMRRMVAEARMLRWWPPWA
jgi:hypothetical protein